MAKVSRRKFLDITKMAVVGGAVSMNMPPFLGSRMDQAFASSSVSDQSDEGEKVIPSYCDVCFMTCGINVTVKNGKALKIEGNPNHPLSRGMLCPRGTAGLGQLYDPDRIKTPLLRTTTMGVQSFKSVSWEVALDYVAEKMNGIKRQYGPQALALMKHCKGSAPFVVLWDAMGSGSDGHVSYAQCRGARDVGWGLTFGKGPGGIERVGLENAKVVAFIGGHLGENMHNTTVQDFTTGLRKGAKNIVVDPRFSTNASKAKYWLPIKPGTDTALLLAWIHVLIYEDLYDKQFVAKHTVGFEQLKEHVRTMTPEWAAEHTDLSAESIRTTARELGNAIPNALLYPGRRFAWYGDDTQRARAMAIVNALLGAWGRDSGIFIGDKYNVPKFDKYPNYLKHTRPIPAFDLKERYPLGGSTPVQHLIEASIPGKYQYGPPCDDDQALIKGWVVYSTNIIRSVPDEALVKEAIENLDLLVVVDTMPSEIAGYADVILPDTTYLERYDGLNNPEWREPFVSIRQPVVKPLYNSKPSWWIAQQLANRLYLEELFMFNDYEEVIEYQLNKMGSSIKDINEKGGVLKKPATPPKMKFRTRSGKVELFSETMQQAGYDPMPKFTEQEKSPDGYFRLLYGRTPQHTFAKTVNNPILMELFPENEVWVNPVIAKQFNLVHGSRVVLKNQDQVKSNPVKVRVTKRIRQDCVYMVHGFGRTEKKLTKAYKKGANDNGLLTKYVTDPIMGSTGSQVNFVTFSK